MTSTRHSSVFLLALCCCNLGPFVIGENGSVGDGASVGAFDTTSADGFTTAASASGEDASAGDDCVGDCVPVFAWCYEEADALLGIDWDPEAGDVVALFGRDLTIPQVHRIDPVAGALTSAFALPDTPEYWSDLYFSFGNDGGVALVFGPSPYRVQTRPGDMSVVDVEFVRADESPTTYTAKDVARDRDGRTVVVGGVEAITENPHQEVTSVFVEAWDSEGNLVAQTELPASAQNRRILGVADDGAVLLWMQGEDHDTHEQRQFVRWLDASLDEVAAADLSVFPISGPLVRDGNGFHYVAEEPGGLSLHRLDGDLVEIDAGYDLFGAVDVDVDPYRVVVAGGRTYVVMNYDPFGESELQLRSYGTDDMLDHVVPFPPLAIDQPGASIDDVVVAGGAIFVAGSGGAGGGPSSFVCRIDP